MIYRSDPHGPLTVAVEDTGNVVIIDSFPVGGSVTHTVTNVDRLVADLRAAQTMAHTLDYTPPQHVLDYMAAQQAEREAREERAFWPMHQHEFEGQTLTHRHRDLGEHGYYEHPEDLTS